MRHYNFINHVPKCHLIAAPHAIDVTNTQAMLESLTESYFEDPTKWNMPGSTISATLEYFDACDPPFTTCLTLEEIGAKVSTIPAWQDWFDAYMRKELSGEFTEPGEDEGADVRGEDELPVESADPAGRPGRDQGTRKRASEQSGRNTKSPRTDAPVEALFSKHREAVESELSAIRHELAGLRADFDQLINRSTTKQQWHQWYHSQVLTIFSDHFMLATLAFTIFEPKLPRGWIAAEEGGQRTRRFRISKADQRSFHHLSPACSTIISPRGLHLFLLSTSVNSPCMKNRTMIHLMKKFYFVRPNRRRVPEKGARESPRASAGKALRSPAGPPLL